MEYCASKASIFSIFFSVNTGSPSSKYGHRRASALLRINIQNIRICMGKKPIVSVTYENEKENEGLNKGFLYTERKPFT